MRKVFIFDYDDTLVWNNLLYNKAHTEFLNWILKQLGPKTPEIPVICRVYEKIDTEAVKTMGFSSERFPTSIKKTYKKICQSLGVKPLEKDLEKAYQIGKMAFDENLWKEQGLVEGAEETLDFLLEQNDKLILLTKGDINIQRKKIEATNCKKWFGENIYIIPKKDKTAFDSLLKEKPIGSVWHVGNSMKSDVRPALEAGIKMIYIPCETWAYEREDETKKLLKTIDPNQVLVYNEIIEIKKNYKRLK